MTVCEAAQCHSNFNSYWPNYTTPGQQFVVGSLSFQQGRRSKYMKDMGSVQERLTARKPSEQIALPRKHELFAQSA
jgi:hypothetical protein